MGIILTVRTLVYIKTRRRRSKIRLDITGLKKELVSSVARMQGSTRVIFTWLCVRDSAARSMAKSQIYGGASGDNIGEIATPVMVLVVI